MQQGGKLTVTPRRKCIVFRPRTTCSHYGVEVRTEHIDVEVESLRRITNGKCGVPSRVRAEHDID